VTGAALPVEAARAYEALRAQALGQVPTATPRGLALFLRAGLAGWLAACAAPGSAAPPPRADGGRPPAARPAPDAELVRVLAAMALGSRRGCCA
jgi:hypothetical protein